MNKLRRVYFWLQDMQHEIGVNKIALLHDYASLKKYKISREEYSNYKMYSRGKDFRDNFLSYVQAKEFWKILNPREFACLARDKYLSHCILETARIPTSHLFAYYNPEVGVATDLIGGDFDSIRTILNRKQVSKCVVKPSSDSAHGSGVFVCKDIVYTEDDCILTKSDNSQLRLKDILRETPLLFESLITQSKQLSAFNESSVNTIRFMTALYPEGETEIVASFIKIGRAGSDVDNAGNGGNVDCAIDIASGRLFNAIEFNSWHDIKPITHHPDSGCPLEGVCIDNWEHLKAQILNFQARIPYLKTIGWDVAVTDNGPVIIEINNWWDTTGQLFIDKGWKQEIKICHDAWKAYYTTAKHD